MGSGKTYWGRLWAANHGLDFFDLDAVIEAEEGRSISAIFEEKGEDYFRVTESRLLKNFAFKNNFLMACGGGTPCYYDNMQWMIENGTTLFLSASPKFLAERMEGDSSRPLLKAMSPVELLAFIEQKLVEREPFYYRAKRVLKVDRESQESLSSIKFDQFMKDA